MSKYSVGNKVRIREDLVVGKAYGSYYFIYSMSKFKGKEVIITKVLNSEEGEKVYKIEGWYWTDKMIEGLAKDVLKSKYVKCITDDFCCITKNKIYEVISESDDTYLIKIDNSLSLTDKINYNKCHFKEVDSPIKTPKPKAQKGVIKYKIKGDTTTVKFNGKIGKATRNSSDEPDNKIGILIGLCRALNLEETKVQGIINVLFDDKDTDDINTETRTKLENVLMKNDIANMIGILDKYRGVE